MRSEYKLDFVMNLFIKEYPTNVLYYNARKFERYVQFFWISKFSIKYELNFHNWFAPCPLVSLNLFNPRKQFQHLWRACAQYVCNLNKPKSLLKLHVIDHKHIYYHLPHDNTYIIIIVINTKSTVLPSWACCSGYYPLPF